MEDGPPGFPRGSTCPAVLRVSQECVGISHTGLSPSMDDLSRSFCYPFTSLYRDPTTPKPRKVSVWALPLSLAATDGISIDFFSWRYLDVSIPRVRLVHLWIQCTMTGHNPCRVSPFGNLRIKACLTAPRSLSQLTTSFIASQRLGIHRLPFLA